MSLPVIKQGSGLPVLWREHPLDRERPARHILIQQQDRMPTIAEIVAGIPDLPDDIRLDGVARINGIVIPRELWGNVRPKYLPGSVALTLHHPMGKNGNAGTVITIAALIAATLVTAGAAAPLNMFLGAGVLSAGSVGASALAAGITVLGTLAANALAPPPVAPDDPNSNTATGPLLGSSGLGGNAIARGSPIQHVIGTYMVSPQRGTDVLLEQVGYDIWAECIYVLQGPHQIHEVYFDGVLQDGTNPNVAVEHFSALPGATDQTLIQRQSRSDTTPIVLSKHKVNTNLPATGTAGSRLSDSAEAFNDAATIGSNPSGPSDATRTIDTTKIVPEWHRITTRNAPDEFWIMFNFGEGLHDALNTGQSVAAPIRLRMRRQGDSTWINLPELHVASFTAGTFRVTIKLNWSAVPSPTIPKPIDHKGPGFFIAHTGVPGQTAWTPNTSGWIANAWFTGGTVVNATRDVALSHLNYSTTNVRNVWIFEDRAELYLGGVFAHGAGDSDIWEIEIRQGMPYHAADIMTEANSPGAYMMNPTSTGNPTAVYDLFEYRDQVANDYRVILPMEGVRWQSTIQSRSSIWNEDPLPVDDLCKIAVRVRNQSINEVKVLASNYVKLFNGVDWNTTGISSNPAEQFRHVLTSNLGKLPQPDTAIDAANISAWYTHCVDNDYTIDTVIAGKSYRDVLKLIASAGWARERDGEKWGVIIDRDRSAETPGQIFTAREVSEVSIHKPFGKMPDGFRATFINADDSYINDSVTVLDPYNGAATEDGVEEIAYAAFTDADKVEARALFDIKQAHKRQATYSFRTDWLSIMSERGDLIGLNYDRFSALTYDERGFGAARIKSIDRTGSVIDAIHLDGTVRLTNGDILGSDDILAIPDIFDITGGLVMVARVRRLGGAGYVDFDIGPLSGDVSTIYPLTTLDDPSAMIQVGAMLWVGLEEKTELRLIVTSITPADNFQAVITAVDESPEIFA